MSATDLRLERVGGTQTGGFWRGHFQAMASPCEVLVDCASEVTARRLARIAFQEARRIESHWSRYRDGNIMHRINHAGGCAVRVDEETAGMLDYAQTLWQLSEGRFDISSGILRRAWRFDGSDRLPAPERVHALLEHVGWQRVRWEKPHLRMPRGMELDFGGIGKEYAVDRALRLIRHASSVPVLVNFGGDIVCDGPRANGAAWQVGLTDGVHNAALARSLSLDCGGMATSGDAFRYVMRDGRRYGHILDATTGWPVPGAPASVTVVAAHCTLAGMLSTLAILQGDKADRFLREQGVQYHLQAHA
ncbi:FAD:protein FMN transferase [Algiphilus sp.]|uniref:FAD:protein FMN transferase n=1 Tax=Algiphilus sp. TaxID=1872431 RepID=UPI003B52FD9C